MGPRAHSRPACRRPAGVSGWTSRAPFDRMRPPPGGAVVQLVRIPACHAGGRGFESRPLRQLRPALSGARDGTRQINELSYRLFRCVGQRCHARPKIRAKSARRWQRLRTSARADGSTCSSRAAGNPQRLKPCNGGRASARRNCAAAGMKSARHRRWCKSQAITSAQIPALAANGNLPSATQAVLTADGAALRSGEAMRPDAVASGCSRAKAQTSRCADIMLRN